MRRREFITLLGGAAAAPMVAPRITQAQQPAMPVIGFLSTESQDAWASRVQAFRQGLSEQGFVEGRNVTVEYRWAESRTDRLPAMAADLVRRQVAVIAANGAAIPAAKAATSTIPIVFQFGGDPVAFGFAKSLNRPGGNLTGATSLAGELGPKRLELLHEVLPSARTVGGLVNLANPNNTKVAEDFQTAAIGLGLTLRLVSASTDGDFEPAFADIARAGAQGLVIGTDGFLNTRDEQLATLALQHAMPTVFQYREFAVAGGLLGYGGSVNDPSYKVGLYTGRILKGEKPGDLPVQQATKVELFINLKTAKALGITVPLSLLGRADEVIE